MHPVPGLIIFVKNPVAGRVKTRIAKTTGPEKALQIYERLLDHILVTASSVGNIDRYLFFSDFIDDHDRWQIPSFKKRLQSGQTLGERMAHAFQTTLQKHPFAILIGSDCGDLTAYDLECAFMALRRNDCVIGPAYDGGYYLIGLHTLNPAFFEGIAWSTDEVFSHTIQIADRHRLRTAVLPTLHDVDTWDDWKRLGWS